MLNYTLLNISDKIQLRSQDLQNPVQYFMMSDLGIDPLPMHRSMARLASNMSEEPLQPMQLKIVYSSQDHSTGH